MNSNEKAILSTMLQTMIDLPTRDNVLPKYHMVLNIINTHLTEIKKCNTAADARYHFDELQEICDFLCCLVFKEKIDENEAINKFVYDFDRIDDPWLREHMFEQIKNKNYSLRR